ncbi:AlpA family transcriptional regulator [Desulfovibrio sp. JC022]|uniref:helix-turn-helix transcriptional regulator n=1 Tax=Desulfovibrio sp. JC022 TaxID=2593642 RepID=UPI0013D4D97C|nr:AlpA family phage regulatory protein [Desulfovibrio sp. JC022]NDV24430.1 AlpA family phage regulatory protein [Desulfovibrio sp. JC022]
MNINPIPFPEAGFLRLEQVLQFIPLSRSAWWQGVKDERFPKPYKLTPKSTAWKAEDIRALIDELGQEVR